MGKPRLNAGIIALCVAVGIACFLLKGAEAQLASDWISEDSALFGLEGESVGLEIEAGGGQACNGSMGECGLVDEEGEDDDLGHGRQLWRRRYYISYGALSANRVPCRPRSGRSYYSRNCWGKGGAANPYRRACTVITRCYRWTG